MIPSTTAHSHFLLHAISSAQPPSQTLPPEDEVPDVSPNEDTNDDIPIVVHSQQHDKVRHSKLQHMQQRPDRLLQDSRTEPLHSDRCTACSARIGSRAIVLGAVAGRSRAREPGSGCGGDGLGMLADEEAVVFFGGAAQELERDDEEDDADAGASEHALAGDVPGAREEAGVDGVPVPEHLLGCVSWVNGVG